MKAFMLPSIVILLVIAFTGCFEYSSKNKPSSNGKIEEVSVEIPIEGMSCMACMAKVKKTLSGLDGIANVKVNLESKSRC